MTGVTRTLEFHLREGAIDLPRARAGQLLDDFGRWHFQVFVDEIQNGSNPV